MKLITIKATVGNGLEKQDCGEVERWVPETLDEAKAWNPDPENPESKTFSEAEVLDMQRRSFVIDVQRTMRPKVTNEKAKQLTGLQQAALTNPQVAQLLFDQGIKFTPTKENGFLKS